MTGLSQVYSLQFSGTEGSSSPAREQLALIPTAVILCYAHREPEIKCRVVQLIEEILLPKKVCCICLELLLIMVPQSPEPTRATLLLNVYSKLKVDPHDPSKLDPRLVFRRMLADRKNAQIKLADYVKVALRHLCFSCYFFIMQAVLDLKKHKGPNREELNTLLTKTISDLATIYPIKEASAYVSLCVRPPPYPHFHTFFAIASQSIGDERS